MDVKRHKAYQKAPLESRRQSPTKWNTLPISGDRAFECAPSGKRRLRPSEQNLLRRAKRKANANGNFEYPPPFPAPRHCARALPGGVSMRARRHAPRPCPVVRSRRGRARCPHRPWRLATRAAAPPARCAAWHPAPLPERRGLPDAAPCAAIGGARRRPSKTLSVCYLPLPMAHYPGGAMGTSRPTAITHAHYLHALHAAITHAYHRKPSKSPAMAHLWPPPPWGLPTLSARAFALSAGGLSIGKIGKKRATIGTRLRSVRPLAELLGRRLPFA